MIPTIENILKQLVEQKYIPRVLVYSNSDYGRIEAVIYNVQGDNDRNYCGEPSARFEAFKEKYPTFESVGKPFEHLTDALNYIGIYREF